MFVDTRSARLQVRVDGKSDGPVVILAHSLGTDMSAWDPLVRDLSDRFRIIRFDTRGHGSSSIPEHKYSIFDLAEDVLDLLDYFGIEKAYYVGLSLGGMTGQAFAITHSDRLLGLVIAASTSAIAEAQKQIWHDRIAQVREKGTESQVEVTMQRWFTQQAFDERPELITRIRNLVLQTPIEGYIRACEAIADLNLTSELKKISVPCLILVGDQDAGTPPAVSEVIHKNIAGSEFHIIEKACHQLALEREDLVNPLIRDFLMRHS